MRLRWMTVAVAVALGLAIAGPAAAAPAGHAVAAGAPADQPPTRRVCGPPAHGRFACFALLRTTASGAPLSSGTGTSATAPPGLGPAQLQAAYELAAAAKSRGGGQTVALVDAFDDPRAETDLGLYRQQFGLPPCTTANGCFRKVNQDGVAAPLPPPSVDWALEESLDIQMVSAVCPSCHILLAEADDNQAANLAATVATAAKLGATEISNSYGAPEFAGETAYEPFYDQPRVAVTAAAGDFGYGVSYPAASANVTAVGGTSLWPTGNSRGWTEQAWGGTGSGCSTQIPKPAWQHDSCTHRTDNDISAVADPNTAVAAFDSFGEPGWLQVGGTSASSPIVAGFYALEGGATPGGSWPYSHTKNLFDITEGTNTNTSCDPTYLCNAETGYDAPTGLGTPDLTAAPGGGSCTGGWSVVPTPSHSESGVTPQNNGYSIMQDVSALSPSSVWTAGLYYENVERGPAATLGALTDVEHWNGSAWSQAPTPSPMVDQSPNHFAQLSNMSFDRPQDGWAVGSYFGSGGEAPLVERWDGSRWSLSPVLDTTLIGQDRDGAPVKYQAYADGVAAISPSDVWVSVRTITPVGDPNVGEGSMLEHWDGTTWRIVSFPGQQDHVRIGGLHAFSSSDVWAVGDRVSDDGSSYAPIAMHWDGHAWSASQPAVNASVEGLGAVTGSSPDDVWATGFVDNGPKYGAMVPLIEHWDGHAWAIVPANADSTESNLTGLRSVTAVSSSDVWAIGVYNNWAYLIEHWDGHAWAIVPAPATRPNALWGVSASSAANVWAVGGQVKWTPTGQAVFTYAIRHDCGG